MWANLRLPEAESNPSFGRSSGGLQHSPWTSENSRVDRTVHGGNAFYYLSMTNRHEMANHADDTLDGNRDRYSGDESSSRPASSATLPSRPSSYTLPAITEEHHQICDSLKQLQLNSWSAEARLRRAGPKEGYE